MEIVRLTGNYYLKKRFFGGYNIMVEVVGRYFCEMDFTFFAVCFLLMFLTRGVEG